MNVTKGVAGLSVRTITSHAERVNKNLRKMMRKGSGKSANKHHEQLLRGEKKFVTSSTWMRRADDKKINPKVLIRERRVSGILMRELQDLIRSGHLDDDSQYCSGVKVTEIVHSNKANCIVLWDLDSGVEVDTDMNDHLNAISSRIRHRLIHSHVIGQVPRLHFRIDEARIKMHQVEEVLNKDDAVSRAIKDDNDDTECQVTNCITLDDEEDKTSRKAKRNNSSDVSMSMFNINHQQLMGQVLANKAANRKQGFTPVHHKLK